jgi:L-threonylcarbamoyladenylate synthase
MQSSANVSGGADPRSLDEIDDAVREGADLVVDAGALPGTPSTVVDLRAYGSHGTWAVLREGAVARDEIAAALTPTG